MNRHRLIGLLVVVAVIGLGVLICPTPPKKDRINPYTLLDMILASEFKIKYKAKTEYKAFCNGKTIKFTAINNMRDSGLGVIVQHSTSGNRPDTKNQEAASVINTLIKRNYEPLVEGEDIIAGREAWTMRLKPKQKNHPWKQLWIDKKTYHVLASRDWSSRNNIKRSMKTLSIEYRGKMPPYKQPAHQKRVAFNRYGDDGVNRIYHPRYIPTGFVMWKNSSFNGEPHLTYTDGLNTISIIVGSYILDDKKWNAQVTKGIQDSGQALVLCKKSHGKQVIISADLPVKELDKIANSF